MMIPRIPQKTVRRLIAAEGYLELGMPVQALRELDKVSDPGSLTASFSYLRGESLKRIGRYSDAIKPLQYAADLLPFPIANFPGNHWEPVIGKVAKMIWQIVQNKLLMKSLPKQRSIYVLNLWASGFSPPLTIKCSSG